MNVMELQHAYDRITTVWNSGTDEQRVLAGQLMDDIAKLMKFSKRYNPDNFTRKSEYLINEAKKLFEVYVAYRRGENESEIIKLIDAPENKKEITQSISHMKKEPEIKKGQVTLSLRGGKRKGAGRKPVVEKGAVRKVSITLSEDHWKWVGGVCAMSGISLAAYVRELMIKDKSDLEKRLSYQSDRCDH